MPTSRRPSKLLGGKRSATKAPAPRAKKGPRSRAVVIASLIKDAKPKNWIEFRSTVKGNELSQKEVGDLWAVFSTSKNYTEEDFERFHTVFEKAVDSGSGAGADTDENMSDFIQGLGNFDAEELEEYDSDDAGVNAADYAKEEKKEEKKDEEEEEAMEEDPYGNALVDLYRQYESLLSPDEPAKPAHEFEKEIETYLRFEYAKTNSSKSYEEYAVDYIENNPYDTEPSQEVTGGGDGAEAVADSEARAAAGASTPERPRRGRGDYVESKVEQAEGLRGKPDRKPPKHPKNYDSKRDDHVA